MDLTAQKVLFAALVVLTLLWTGFAISVTAFGLAWSLVRAEDVTSFILGKPRLLLLIISPLVPLAALIAVERIGARETYRGCATGVLPGGGT